MKAAVISHIELQALRLWLFATDDAHGLHARHGRVAWRASAYMEARYTEVDRRMANPAGPPHHDVTDGARWW
jgi:hypothetical protein